MTRFILISFPHEEGPTSPGKQATGSMGGKPESVHAQTRLAAEKLLFQQCEGTSMAGLFIPGVLDLT